MNDQTIHDDDFIDPDLDAALHEAWRRGAGKAFEDYRNRRVEVEPVLPWEEYQPLEALMSEHAYEDRMAIQWLLREFFWSLLLKHVRMLLACTIEPNDRTRQWEIFEELNGAITLAVLADNQDNLDMDPDNSFLSVLSSNQWKLVATSPNIGENWTGQTRVYLTQTPFLLPKATPNTRDFHVRFHPGPDTEVALLQISMSIRIKLPPSLISAVDQMQLKELSCQHPQPVTRENSFEALICLLAKVCLSLFRSLCEHLPFDDMHLESPERIWRDLRSNEEPGSVLSRALHLLCNELAEYIGGKAVAWVYTPHPANTNSLRIMAGSETYPDRLFEAVSVSPNDEDTWGLTGRAWTHNRMEISRNARKDTRVMKAAREGVYQCVAIPLSLTRLDLIEVGETPNSLAQKEGDWSLPMGKLGVLYVGLKEETADIQPQHILLLRQFGKVLTGYLADVVYSEHARSGIVEDLRLSYPPLLEFLDPDEDWYVPSGENRLITWLSDMAKSRKVGEQGLLMPVVELDPSERDSPHLEDISFVLAHIDQAKLLSKPPETDLTVARAYAELKKFLRTYIDTHYPNSHFRISDYEHDILLTFVGWWESDVIRLCGTLRSRYAVQIGNSHMTNMRTSVSFGVFHTTFEEIDLQREEGQIEEPALRLKKQLVALKHAVEDERGNPGNGVPIMVQFDRITMKYENCTPESPELSPIADPDSTQEEDADSAGGVRTT